MKILMTGASGFIGSALTAHLRATRSDCELYSLGIQKPKESSVQHFSVDLCDSQATQDSIAKIRPDVVYHLAGSARIRVEVSFPEYFSKNFLTTLSLLEGVRRLTNPLSFFFASSVHVYGNRAESIVSEESIPHPMHPYGFTKYLSEEALKKAASEINHLSVVIGRLYTCIGPGQSQGFVAADLCRKIAELPSSPEATMTVGPMDPIRQFLDVRDLVKIVPELIATCRNRRYEVVNLASSERVEIRELLEQIIDISGKKPRVEISKDPHPNQFRGLRVETAKLQKTLPKTSFRPLRESLKDMYEAARLSRLAESRKDHEYK